MAPRCPLASGLGRPLRDGWPMSARSSPGSKARGASWWKTMFYTTIVVVPSGNSYHFRQKDTKWWKNVGNLKELILLITIHLLELPLNQGICRIRPRHWCKLLATSSGPNVPRPGSDCGNVQMSKSGITLTEGVRPHWDRKSYCGLQSWDVQAVQLRLQ